MRRRWRLLATGQEVDPNQDKFDFIAQDVIAR